MTDVFSRYEDRLDELTKQIPQDDPSYTELLTLGARLQENIDQFRRYGDTETRRAERAQILDSLNRLTLAVMGEAFVELNESESVSSQKESNKVQLSPAEQYQIALHWAENGRRESLYGFDLSSCVLWEVDLERADLRMVNLRNADLGRANLQKANLGGADLRGANLFNTFLHGAKIDDTTQIDDKGRLVLEIIQIDGGAKGRNLRGVDLSNTILVWGELSEADLSGANLNGSTLSAAKLCGADLTNADLSGADLSMADLRKANLRQADLSEADLRGANLSNANLVWDSAAIDSLLPGNLTGAKYNSSTIWPENFSPTEWGAVFQDKS